MALVPINCQLNWSINANYSVIGQLKWSINCQLLTKISNYQLDQFNLPFWNGNYHLVENIPQLVIKLLIQLNLIAGITADKQTEVLDCIKVKGQTVQTGDCKHTNKRTDGWTWPNLLSPLLRGRWLVSDSKDFNIEQFQSRFILFMPNLPASFFPATYTDIMVDEPLHGGGSHAPGSLVQK